MAAELGLGTVAFGLPYGIAEGRQVSESDMTQIMDSALHSGIRYIDTAFAYQESQARLGQYFQQHPPAENLRVISKTPPNLRSEAIDASQLMDLTAEACQTIGIPHLHGLLLHDINDLFSNQGAALREAMDTLKESGLVQKVGVSVYTAEDVEHLLNIWSPDIVQVPINLFDQRLIHSGTLSDLKEKGVEIHARSVFLQGAALMAADRLPPHLTGLRPLLQRLDELGPRLPHLLNFIKTATPVDVAILGVHTPAQWQEIYDGWHQDLSPTEYASFTVYDTNLLDPRTWPAS